jgi:hypothetical protein
MITFKRNMSTGDRLVRTLVGSTLLVLGPLTNVLVLDTLSSTLLGVLGTTAILSALFSYCFLYEVTGFCTLKDPE